MADHDKKEEEEDVQGHKLVADPAGSHVAGPESLHVGANKDDEDDVEGHSMLADQSHVARPFTDTDKRNEI